MIADSCLVFTKKNKQTNKQTNKKKTKKKHVYSQNKKTTSINTCIVQIQFCSIIDFNRSGLILPDSRTFSRTFPSLAVKSSHCMKNQITNFSQGFKRGLLQLLHHDFIHELIFCSFYKIQTRLLIENNSNLIE